jgi:glycosyltransferase involved in cell wall biosynthesis
MANALAERHEVSALLARRLVPRVLYPGRRRVGVRVNDLDYRADVPALEVLDWYWGTSMIRALRHLRSWRPTTVVFQWWTGATLHTYLLLAAVARRRGARVVLEWHEVQDTGEARIPGVAQYVSRLMGALLTRVDGHVVHSEFDLAALRSRYAIDGPVEVVPHGPYDHVVAARSSGTPPGSPGRPASDRDGQSCTTVLYFGVVRPYKGVEDLVTAFGRLPDSVARDVRLLLVGETWEGWTAHREAVRVSPRRDQIVIRDEYVSDAEVAAVFAQADAVALPYRRSSSSGPLHLAMSAGLPVLVTDVGGLMAAAGDYEGAVFVPADDVDALCEGLVQLLARRGLRYNDPRSWQDTLDAFDRLLRRVDRPRVLPPVDPASIGVAR